VLESHVICNGTVINSFFTLFYNNVNQCLLY